MHTRADYMKGKCTHEDYYAQFVTDRTRDKVARIFTTERLLASRDEHLNDIPLARWDAAAVPVSASAAEKMREAGDYPTLAGAVCILKEAARQIIAAERCKQKA